MRRTATHAGILFMCLLGISLLHGQQEEKTGPIGPTTVAQVALKNQSQAIPLTTLFTPQKDGLFRISAFLEVTTRQAQSINLCYNLFWRDDTPVPESTVPTSQSGLECVNVQILGGPDGLAQFSFVTRLKANAPVNYDTIGTLQGAQYGLFITVEELE